MASSQGVIAVAADGAAPAAKATTGLAALGTIDDNQPFDPNGLRLASLALRTWVYTDVGPKRTRYGYLRAGAVVDARGPSIENDGCQAGWYRVNPRGFVCIGKGATLDLQHPIVKAASVRPIRGDSLPYTYALAGDNPPYFYFRLPTAAEATTVEGSGVQSHIAVFRERAKGSGASELLASAAAPPEHLVTARAIEKPYGAHRRLHYSVHSGRAASDSGFALAQVFEAEGRYYGLSTEHDVIALDRTRLVRPSEFHGIEFAEEDALPAAFVESRWAIKYSTGDAGVPRADGSFSHRAGLKLTGTKRQALLETRDGNWVAAEAVRVIAPRSEYPSFATGQRKWLDISISEQSLVAYVGKKPVYATLVSTGRGGMGDPEKTFATVRGTFMIHTKHVSATMDGEDDQTDSYNLLDVPFVQYFHKGYALHGTYWHDEFGKIRSHGCINLAPRDAAWLFEWTDPAVPSDWHGVINLERGTVVHIRA